jgi:hypothetical protein
MPHELDEIICALLEEDPGNRPGDGMVLFRRLDSLKRKLAYQATHAGDDTPHPTAPAIPQAMTRVDATEEGSATLMSRLMREELERQKQGGPIRQFFNRPVVLLVLLAVTVGLILWTFWPLSSKRMYERGAALMKSDNPEDWETAWDKYLGPLLEKEPDTANRGEVEKFRDKVEEARGQRREKLAADFAGPMSEPQWFYQEGLRYHQRGEDAEARRIWSALVKSFQDVKMEEPWVKLARQALEKPASQSIAERHWTPVRLAVNRARELREQGKQKEASAILDGLKELYRGDKQAEAIINGN